MEWTVSEGRVGYEEAVAAMEHRVQAIRDGRAREQVWLLEHPSLYTAGTSARPSDLLNNSCLPVYPTGRGGQYTYHGPGQRIAYLMLDLKQRGADLRLYLRQLEEWMIAALADCSVEGFTREGRTGVWVRTGGSEAKIAAIGIRVRQWVSYHGVSINVNPDLSYYAGIVPCGIRDYGVTSLATLGLNISMLALDTVLKRHFDHCLPFISQD